MSPCAYFDFYRANGFEFRLFERKIRKTGSEIRERAFKPFLTEIPEKVRMVWNGLAKRESIGAPITFPMQSRFVEHHTKKAVKSA